MKPSPEEQASIDKGVMREINEANPPKSTPTYLISDKPVEFVEGKTWVFNNGSWEPLPYGEQFLRGDTHWTHSDTRPTHTPNESPATKRTVPESWMNLAAESYLRDYVVEGDSVWPKEVAKLAAVILKHAPPPPAHGGLVEAKYLSGTVEILGNIAFFDDEDERGTPGIFVKSSEDAIRNVEANYFGKYVVLIPREDLLALTAPPPAGNDGALARVEAERDAALREVHNRSYLVETNDQLRAELERVRQEKDGLKVLAEERWQQIVKDAEANAKDLADTRRFQANLIRVTHENNELRAQLQAAVEGERELAECMGVISRHGVLAYVSQHLAKAQDEHAKAEEHSAKQYWTRVADSTLEDYKAIEGAIIKAQANHAKRRAARGEDA